MSGEAPGSTSTTKRTLPRTGYPRRRAVTACEVCRERKKKCDNSRPSCSFCLRIGARCDYRDRNRDEASFDPQSLAILDRLSDLEALIRQRNTAESTSSSVLALTSVSHVSPRMNYETVTTPSWSSAAAMDINVEPAPTDMWNLYSEAESRLRLDKILRWPIFRAPLSGLPQHPYLTFRGERDYTYVEDMVPVRETMVTTQRQHEPLQQGHLAFVQEKRSLSTIERAQVEHLTDRFFILVHVKNPILDRQTVQEYCRDFCEHGVQQSLRSCLMLLICALGSAAPEYQPLGPLQPNHDWHRRKPRGGEDVALARCYFAVAEEKLGMTMAQPSTLAAQCLCLAGIFQMYSINIVAAQALFHAAGYAMQSVSFPRKSHPRYPESSSSPPQPPTPPSEDSEVGSSLYWAIFKSERELFAQTPNALPVLGRPSDGSYPLPPRSRFITWSGASPDIAGEDGSGHADDAWARTEQDSWYFFLSEIACRQIYDKAAEVVGKFFRDTDTDTATNPPASASQDHIVALVTDYIPIALELERQAVEWRENLPPSVAFVDVPALAASEWVLLNRYRFYRLIEMLHRPFVFAACTLRPGRPSRAVLDLAHKGLCYTLMYLQGGHPTHAHHGRALTLRYELKHVCLLFAGSGAPGIEMPAGWYESVLAHVRSLRYWEADAEYLGSYLRVVVALDEYFVNPERGCLGRVREMLETGLGL